VLGALSALALFGCTPAQTSSAGSASGSLALSRDDAYLYAADTDNGTLEVVDAAKRTRVAEVKVGTRPTRVLVGADETIYVANRGSRSVSVVEKGTWKEVRRLDTALEPTGLALSTDGKSLLVVCATARDSVETGTLMSFDTVSSALQWELAVGAEPRAVVALADGKRALVSLFKQGEVVEVDLSTHQVLRASTGLYAAANAHQTGTVSTFAPRAVADLIVTPDGKRVFAPVVWAREDKITTPPNAYGGYYAGGGPCDVGAVATAGIVTFNTTDTVTPQVDDLTSCFSTGGNTADGDYPVSTLAPRQSYSGSDPATPIQGPTVGVVDGTNQWLFVVNRESSNVAVMPAWRRTGDDLSFSSTGTSVRSTVDVGAGADGIALSKDGRFAYVYSQFDHRIDVLGSSGTGAQAVLANVGNIVVAQDTLPPAQVQGRRLFYDARDTRMSAAGTNVACSTCHLEGREDGHVWQFVDGPRQTPMLAGRRLLDTAPYHWSGEFPSIENFDAHTITERMGGSGLSQPLADTLNAFIEGLPLADNPFRGSAAPELQRGRAAYEKAGCVTCHQGELFTNRQSADVGTLVLAGSNPDTGAVTTRGFDVPSLLGLSRSAPYLHDGSMATLEDRIYSVKGDGHGTLSALDDAEKADLVKYLKSL
jgi:YVTN family beta-propeller protein